MTFPLDEVIRPLSSLAVLLGKTLDSNDQNQVADQRFSLKQWFAGVLNLAGSENLGVAIVI